MEACWTAVRQPGPLRAFYERVRARRGHSVAIVAAARKLACLFWCLLSREEDYAFQQPSPTKRKLRQLVFAHRLLDSGLLEGAPMGQICATYVFTFEDGFLYDSDACGDDVPYYEWHGDRPFLVVPYSKTYNDSRYLTNPGFGSPRDLLDTLLMGLDELLREGPERRTMMTACFHARWSGQAGRAAVLRQFLEHALGQPGVRFMRRADIANWWLERYPARR